MDITKDIAFLIKDEIEAIEGYDKILNKLHSEDIEVIKVLRHIRDEEIEHVKELNKLLGE